MAHILLGWELGGNRGHATTLLAIARSLVARGHRVTYALQRLDSLSAEGTDGAEVWQAPITPRLLLNTAKVRGPVPITMGDILVRLGVDDSRLTASLIAGWDRLLGAIRPDLVISEYGPFLLLAARGRVPTISIGTSFSTPPAHLERFPTIGGAAPVYGEAEALSALNEALRRTGRAPLEAYPNIFASNRELAGGFTELDPYRASRLNKLARPMTSGPVEIAPEGGEEVFVYAPEQVRADAPLWEGLAKARLPIRIFVSSVSSVYRDRLRAMGLVVEDQAVPFAEIARRSRLLVSHGGHGFLCSGLLAGLPHVVCHFDLEKFGYARAITELGVGGMVGLPNIDPDAFADSLVQVYHNQGLIDRARALAPDFQARHHQPMEEDAADAAEQLLRGAATG